MTVYQFRLLVPRAQLLHILTTGTYLARRWEEGAISLYYLPDEGRGVFVEVGYDAYKHGAVVLRSFSDSEALEDYAHGVRLPK
ncbi:MAG: hypothetical protein ACRYFZ_11895 [Janthinobacterium lividum]